MKRGRDTEADTQREDNVNIHNKILSADGGRDRNDDVSTSQRTPRIGSKPRNDEKGMKFLL